jgi:hypothetical protein
VPAHAAFSRVIQLSGRRSYSDTILLAFLFGRFWSFNLTFAPRHPPPPGIYANGGYFGRPDNAVEDGAAVVLATVGGRGGVPAAGVFRGRAVV